MTIQNLRYIIEIARCNSISKAAKSLFMTQSAISNAVKETEAELGIQIFNRTSHGVTLTYDGEDFLPYCKEIVAKMDYIHNRYQQRSSIPTSFSVSCQHLPFAARAFRTLAEEFQDASFELTLWELALKEIFHDVNSGQSEIGVFLFSDDQVPEIRKLLYLHDLTYTELAQPPVSVFLRKEHPLASHSFLTPEDLTPYPCVTFDHRNDTEQFPAEVISLTSLNKYIHVCDRSTKLAMIQKSDAFCIDTELFVDKPSESQEESSVLSIPFHMQDRIEIVHTGYVLSKKHTVCSTCQRYIELLKRECQDTFF